MYRIEMACINHTGYVRENNEDNLYFNGQILDMEHKSMRKPLTADVCTEKLAAAAVFDGMGGENAGEVASYVAAKGFLDECGMSFVSRRTLAKLAEDLNRKVWKKAQKERLGQIGTTATMLFFHQNYAYLSNVGDSPAYILRNGRFQLISEKHTNEELLRLSNIKNRRPALTQFLGIPEEEMALEPYIAGIELRADDKFLICSDGLTDMAADREISDILGRDLPVSQIVMELLVKALIGGGRDNITIICCQVKEEAGLQGRKREVGFRCR